MARGLLLAKPLTWEAELRLSFSSGSASPSPGLWSQDIKILADKAVVQFWPPCFPDGETEAQRGEATCLRSYSWWGAGSVLGPLSTPARPSSGCTKWWVVSDKKENAEDDTIGTQHSGSLPGEGWQTLASARQPGGPRLEGITAKPG